MQILLVGQQELDEKLDSVDLRQLKQRIALRSHLASLDLEETCGYVYRRLQIAGSPNPAEIFPMETIVELHRQSRGLPRLVNTICENALIHGYARQAHSIPAEVIEEIAADFRLNVLHPSTAEPELTGRRFHRSGTGGKNSAWICIRIFGIRQDGKSDLRMIVGGGIRKNEPYI